MNFKAILILIFLFFSCQAVSQTNLAESAFADYAAGNFDQALNKYNSLIDAGSVSADIYYNMGCLYLKQNKIGNARLYFERALNLEPSSINVKNGIAQTKARIEPSIESLPPFILYKWFISIRDLLAKAGWGLLLFISIVSISGYQILKLVNGIFSFNKMSFVLLAFTVLFFLMYISRHYYEKKQTYILANNHPLRVAPEENSQIALPLGEGTKILVVDSLQNWYKVTLENNDEGWLPKSVATKI